MGWSAAPGGSCTTSNTQLLRFLTLAFGIEHMDMGKSSSHREPVRTACDSFHAGCLLPHVTTRRPGLFIVTGGYTDGRTYLDCYCHSLVGVLESGNGLTPVGIEHGA